MYLCHPRTNTTDRVEDRGGPQLHGGYFLCFVFLHLLENINFIYDLSGLFYSFKFYLILKCLPCVVL